MSSCATKRLEHETHFMDSSALIFTLACSFSSRLFQSRPRLILLLQQSLLEAASEPRACGCASFNGDGHLRTTQIETKRFMARDVDAFLLSRSGNECRYALAWRGRRMARDARAGDHSEVSAMGVQWDVHTHERIRAKAAYLFTTWRNSTSVVRECDDEFDGWPNNSHIKAYMDSASSGRACVGHKPGCDDTSVASVARPAARNMICMTRMKTNSRGEYRSSNRSADQLLAQIAAVNILCLCSIYPHDRAGDRASLDQPQMILM